jgi:hypothetical protein
MNTFDSKIDLEVVLREVPEILNDLNLKIGNVAELNNEIFKIQTLQNRLEEFKKFVQQELDFESFKNGAVGAIPYLGMAAGLFIPGGFIADIFIGSGLKAITDNFSDRDRELSLKDVIEDLEIWIDWSIFLFELAEEMIDNSEFIQVVHHSRQFLSIDQQIEQLSENLNIVLKSDSITILEQQIEQIHKECDRLRNIEDGLKIILTAESCQEDNNYLIDEIIPIILYFGNKQFSLIWIDEENNLIFSSGDRITTSFEIFENCIKLKLYAENLFVKANNLIFQAQQYIDRLEEQEKAKQQEASKAEKSQLVEQVHNLKQIDRKNYKIIYLIVILSLSSFIGIFSLNNSKISTPLNSQIIKK